jgi:hypothetical protein
MTVVRKYQSLSNGELHNKEKEILLIITEKRDMILKALDEVLVLQEELKEIDKEHNARE